MTTGTWGSVVSEKRKGVIFCSYEGKWKDELEERLQTEGRVTLLALGRIRYELPTYHGLTIIFTLLNSNNRENLVNYSQSQLER